MSLSIKQVNEEDTILSLIAKYYDQPPEGLPSIASLFHFEAPEEPKIFLVSMLEKRVEDRLPVLDYETILYNIKGHKFMIKWAQVVSKALQIGAFSLEHGVPSLETNTPNSLKMD